MKDKFLTRAEAAQYLTEQRGLQVAKATLEKWVTRGGGPEYQRFGKRAVYLQSNLDAWAGRKLTPASSSAPALAPANS